MIDTNTRTNTHTHANTEWQKRMRWGENENESNISTMFVHILQLPRGERTFRHISFVDDLLFFHFSSWLANSAWLHQFAHVNAPNSIECHTHYIDLCRVSAVLFAFEYLILFWVARLRQHFDSVSPSDQFPFAAFLLISRTEHFVFDTFQESIPFYSVFLLLLFDGQNKSINFFMGKSIFITKIGVKFFFL